MAMSVSVGTPSHPTALHWRVGSVGHPALVPRVSHVGGILPWMFMIQVYLHLLYGISCNNISQV